MKKQYTAPESEIVVFDSADVLTARGSRATDYNYNPTTGNREGPYDGRYD